jgi:tRNA(fMet)-specific endonuclease VapC
MSGKKLLLDTNIIIGLFANNETIVTNLSEAKTVFIPSIALGELYFGAEQSRLRSANIQKVESFAKSCVVLGCDIKTAKYYGRLKAQLKAKGTPIPENDIWIASLALQHKLLLVTRDKHFKNIAGISIIEW